MRWVAHYLDDFILLGGPGSSTCQVSMDALLQVCRELGVPVSAVKCAGPTTCLVFLGFELDSVQMVIKLPDEKLMALVEEWVVCKKKDLESLLGHLQHAATVVRPGRTFVRCLIELLASVKDARRWIRLNAAAATCSDLQWWSHFLEEWNGVSMLPRLSQAGFEVHSDASGMWGGGAYWDSHWLW